MQRLTELYDDKETFKSITPVHEGGSKWVDMAISPQNSQVFLAAGARGLLSIPLEFDESTVATRVLDGNVSAVHVLKDGTMWAINSGILTNATGSLRAPLPSDFVSLL